MLHNFYSNSILFPGSESPTYVDAQEQIRRCNGNTEVVLTYYKLLNSATCSELWVPAGLTSTTNACVGIRDIALECVVEAI